MNLLKYLLVGFIFGIVLTKAEAISWYRIYEMFQFESFHMYGIIMTAIVTGVIGLQIIKIKKIKDIAGNPIYIQDKEDGNVRLFLGGLLFGLGWALVGACPGPIFILLGSGFMSAALILFGAIFGTFLYGVVKNKLPH